MNTHFNKSCLLPTLIALIVSILPARSVAQMQNTVFRLSDIGASTRERYPGDGLSIVKTEVGASLRCVFQKLEGRVDAKGLWLISTACPSNSPLFHVVARSIGREEWSSLPLADTGEVETTIQSARFHRANLDEEYTVCADGIRQDFIVTSRLAGSDKLRVNLSVGGARVEPTSDGARFVLDASYRKLAYNHLKVNDACGRELDARMEVVSPNQLEVVVDDADATYPIRIDPTFSDANWIGLGGLSRAVLDQITALACDSSGNLYAAGFTNANGSGGIIAEWNGSTWTTLATISSPVFALICDRFGNLYAGGDFTSLAGVFAGSIAKWNGSGWSALGSGVTGFVNALACDNTGNLYAGGYSLTGFGGNTNNIAKWNGTNWTTLGAGLSGANDDYEEAPVVYALAIDGFGNLYAGGDFTTAGGVSANNIAKWNGTNWSALGSGIVACQIYALACDTNGNVYAGLSDTFLSATFPNGGVEGSSGVVEWNGSSWSGVGSTVSSDVYSLVFDSSGNLYAGGSFTTAFGEIGNCIAKWNGLNWSALGSGMGGGDYIGNSVQGGVNGLGLVPAVNALALDGYGSLYAGGNFYTAGTNIAYYVAEALLTKYSVTTTSLPSGTNLVPYSQQLSAVNGRLPYSWSILSGSLPLGLTLAVNGLISGMPMNSGTFNFSVKVSDALSATATRVLTLVILPNVTIQPPNNFVAATTGNNVTFVASVTGTGPFSYQWQCNGINLLSGIITTVAGNGRNGYSGDGGAATNATLSASGVSVDHFGNLFIADYSNSRIRKVDTNGIITTAAGGALSGFAGDGGISTNAELNSPSGVAVDAAGNLFIADVGNDRVRKVGTNGIISTVAGNGTNGYSGDGGAATNAELNGPVGVAVDTSGNLFIADSQNNRLRVVRSNGIITTLAGNGTADDSGDGGAATNGELDFPYCVAVDAVGNIFIADIGGTNLIRKVGTDGTITTVAGGGNKGLGDGGAATNAGLNASTGMAVDTVGNLFIADQYNYRLRDVGANGIITTVAGNGTNGYSGDGGAATNAELGRPFGVVRDPTGNFFISEWGNNRIRKVVNLGVPVTGPALVLNDVGFGNAGAYDVVVSCPYGSVTSSVVNLTITLPVTLSTPQIAVGATNFTFQLSGPAGSNYVLQVSTNLLNWSSVSTSSIPVGGSIILSNTISGYNRRFYRAYLE